MKIVYPCKFGKNNYVINAIDLSLILDYPRNCQLFNFSSTLGRSKICCPFWRIVSNKSNKTAGNVPTRLRQKWIESRRMWRRSGDNGRGREKYKNFRMNKCENK
jgi:hypothetical protein